MIVDAMPFVILGWLLIALADSIYMLFVGRIIVCLFTCMIISSVGVYISETVHPDLRGSLGIMSPCLMSGGYLMDWIIGEVLLPY